MNQRCCASPVFIRCVRVKNLRCGFGFCCSVQQPRCFSCLRIGLWNIREREQVRRIENTRHWLRVARRLRKTMVEASASRSGYVSDYAVHHLPALLVSVEDLVNKMAKKAPALRNS